MKISTEQRQYYKSRIRSVIAQHPQISQVALATRLKADGLSLDRKCLGSLLNDIYTERSKRANTWMLNQALSAFQDTMMEISAVAWSIANDDLARKQDSVAALREIREAHKDMFEKLFDAGVFERKLGTLDATKLHELSMRRPLARMMVKPGGISFAATSTSTSRGLRS